MRRNVFIRAQTGDVPLFGNNRVMPHHFFVKPRFGELDPYNHVNHAVYVAWFEAARCDALASVDASLSSLSRQGLQMVVTDLEIGYRIPACADDELVIETVVTEARGVTSRWEQRLVSASDSSRVFCTAKLRVGSCDANGRPARIVPTIRIALEKLAV